MLETLMIGGVISLLIAISGISIALKIQHGSLMRMKLEQQAWERAQEGRQRNWESRQEKSSFQQEERLVTQVQQIRTEWQAWQAKDAERVKELSLQFKNVSAQLNLEKDLARLPYVEEMPIPAGKNGQFRHALNAPNAPNAPTNWQPPSFHKANLAGRDLSRRYLERVDLREAQLEGANFYMANLSGACLAGANLAGANLAGANLSGADLRDAKLTAANLLVADLHNTVLIGANLLGAHNLKTQQVYSAIYDNTTLIDPEVDLTQPRLSNLRQPTKPTRLLPLTLHDNLPFPTVPFLLKDRQESRRTDELGTATPNPIYNGVVPTRVD